jgi:lactobin A/cerein 7B family class IIb bacteriocin
MQTNNKFSFNNFPTIDSEEELQKIVGGVIGVGVIVAAIGVGVAIYSAGYAAGRDRALAGKKR